MDTYKQMNNEEINRYVEKQSQAFGMSKDKYTNNCMNNYIESMKKIKDEINDKMNMNKGHMTHDTYKQMNNEEINRYVEKQSQAFGMSKDKYTNNCMNNYIESMKKIKNEINYKMDLDIEPNIDDIPLNNKSCPKIDKELVKEEKQQTNKSEKSKDDEFMKTYLEKQRRRSLSKEHQKDLGIER